MFPLFERAFDEGISRMHEERNQHGTAKIIEKVGCCNVEYFT
jgi:hypothetical protein